MKSHLWRVDIEDYEPLSGEEAVERILHKAHRLRGLRELNVSSTFYGGGVAELLSSATLPSTLRRLGVDVRVLVPGYTALLAARADALARADRAWRDKALWNALQRRGMLQDFSWDRSTASYLSLFTSLTLGA